MQYTTIDLAQLRAQKGWSLADVGQRLGIARQQYFKYEKRRSIPKREMIESIANLFDVNYMSVVIYFYQ